ncbi:hypothetical protein [Echinicola strongylocentroti]|nr:hypothetical protein [Echinicola strongylocentroti]
MKERVVWIALVVLLMGLNGAMLYRYVRMERDVGLLVQLNEYQDEHQENA